MAIEYTGTLRNWRVEDYFGAYRIIGKIYNDARKDFEDGTTIVTTSLTSINFAKNQARTKSGSVYRLE